MSVSAAVLDRMEWQDARILAEYAAAGSTMRGVAKSVGVTLDEVSEVVTDLAGMDRGKAAALSLAWQKTAKAVTTKAEMQAQAEPEPVEDVRPVVAVDLSELVPPPEPEPVAEPEGNDAEPEPELVQRPVGDVDRLLAEAASSGTPKLAKAAEKIRELITALREDVAEHMRETGLREELARIEARAAEIRTRLKPQRSSPASVPLSRTVDSKAVREWAARNGIEVHAQGIVPNRVVEAYLAATS